MHLILFIVKSWINGKSTFGSTISDLYNTELISLFQKFLNLNDEIDKKLSLGNSSVYLISKCAGNSSHTIGECISTCWVFHITNISDHFRRNLDEMFVLSIIDSPSFSYLNCWICGCKTKSNSCSMFSHNSFFIEISHPCIRICM